MQAYLKAAHDWVVVTLGFKRVALIDFTPPDSMIREVSPGLYARPNGAIKTEVVLWFNLRSRFRLLFSGKVHVVTVVWVNDPVVAAGDSISWGVLPPFDPLDPKLKV